MLTQRFALLMSVSVLCVFGLMPQEILYAFVVLTAPHSSKALAPAVS